MAARPVLAPPQCVNGCKNWEQLHGYHLTKRNKDKTQNCFREIDRRIRNLPNQTVMIAAVINSIINDSITEVYTNGKTDKKLAKIYYNLMRSHLSYFHLEYNKQKKRIEKRIPVAQDEDGEEEEDEDIEESDESDEEAVLPTTRVPVPTNKRRRV